MVKVLISGFEPFGGETMNPSIEAINLLSQMVLPYELITVMLPVTFHESSQILLEKIHQVQPDIIVMVGQAGGRNGISIERIALNIDDSKMPDNNGISPKNEVIIPEGPVAYISTLPTLEIVNQLLENEIPSHLSYHAGTYVCNHIFYHVMHKLSSPVFSSIKAVFIHVPYETSQVERKRGIFSLDLSQMTKALKIVIEVSLHDGLIPSN